MVGAAIAQMVEGLFSNVQKSCLFDSCSQHVEVSLRKALNSKFLLILCHECMSVCE